VEGGSGGIELWGSGKLDAADEVSLYLADERRKWRREGN